MRVSDYIAKFIRERLNVKDVFMITGGGMMFLSDGVALNKSLNIVFNHHEQASAMGAFAYAKYTGNWGVTYVTTGCGATNAMTGLLDAWEDNIPVLFISGQVKRKETTYKSGLPLRQFGVQEANVLPAASHFTKFSAFVDNPEDIKFYLEKAAYLGTIGRPGPVWLDVPLDVQGFPIDEEKLRGFDPKEIELDFKTEPKEEEIKNVINLLKSAKRPVILAGQGIRLGKALPEFRQFVERHKIPVVGTYLAIDYLPSGHELFIGRSGLKGDRAGNFALQNCDVLLTLGCRLSVTVTGYEYGTFAREAKKIVVDIDPKEHLKNTVKIDYFVNADIKEFFTKINEEFESGSQEWREKCLSWKKSYPVCLPEYSADPGSLVNLYYFTDCLSKELKKDAVVVSDAGSAMYVPAQALMLKNGQRFVTSGGDAEMGFTLPATIGVCVAKNGEEVVGITGDGSFQFNIQELQTIVHNNYPIKLFVWNNDGYLSIRATQKRFFEGREHGTDKSNGVSFPELRKISEAYGIPYVKISNNSELVSGIKQTLEKSGPVICEVICLRDQEIIPTVSSQKKADGSMVSKPLEDMYPFLDREEFKKQMIIKPLEENA